MKKRTLITISIVSFLLAALSFYAATRFIDELAHEKLFATVVKVADGREIAPYEPITQEDVVQVDEETDEIMAGAATSLQEVIGKRSIQTIYAGEQILGQKLRDGHLLPEKGMARYEFPLTEMIPITELRKGDFVRLWVRYRTKSELTSLPSPAFFQKTNDSAEMLFESQLVTVKDNNGIEVYTLKPSLVPGKEQIGDTLFHGSEAGKYADGERRYRDYRAQPSSLAAFVGFNLTDQQYRVLTEAMHYGTIQFGHIQSKGGGQS